MRTYPHRRDDGTGAYFEISNALPWSLGFMRRVLTSVPGVTDFKRICFSDDRYAFRLAGRDCVVHEPFGDNSRYWIGPVEMEPPIDMTAVQCAFSRFAAFWTLDREFRKPGAAQSTRTALQAALPKAAEELSKLRAMIYADLARLPAHETRELDGYGRRVTITTYVDLIKHQQSDLQVVVQAAAHGRGGFSRVWARGFRLSPDGSCRNLADEELYEYT